MLNYFSKKNQYVDFNIEFKVHIYNRINLLFLPENILKISKYTETYFQEKNKQSIRKLFNKKTILSSVSLIRLDFEILLII